MNYKSYILFFIFLSYNTTISCKDLFLETALNLGMKNNKILIAKKKEIENTKAQLSFSVRNFLPYVFFQRKYGRGSTINEENWQEEEIGLKLQQPIYDGGRLYSYYKYNQLAVKLAELEYIRAKEELIYNIKNAYYEYLAAVMEIKEIENMIVDINKYYEKLLNEHKAKAISDLDLEEGKIFVEKVKNTLEKSKKNKELFENRLLFLIGIKSFNEIIFPIPFESFEEVPKEIDFKFEDLKNLLYINNIVLKKLEIQKEMLVYKKTGIEARTKPRFYLDAMYGQSGSAYVEEPLSYATVWNIMFRLSWMFGYSSFDSYYLKEKTTPKEILDVSQKIDGMIVDTKISFFDDLKYYVEKKEYETEKYSLDAEYENTKKTLFLELEKSYLDYNFTLIDSISAKNELNLRKWQLEVSKKRNIVYEIPTIEVLGAIYKVSEAVISYSKSVLNNYNSVANMEKLLLINLR